MATTLSELKELMRSAGLDAELVEDLDPAKPLLQQGVDSVDFPAFALALEARYGIKVSDADSLRLKTLNDFLSFIADA